VFHTSVVFDNRIWVLGGYDGSYRNDVWYSSDGVNWYCATENAPWSGRSGHTSVVFDNKIWVLGGYDGSYRNDVWYSSDGINWYCTTKNAPWPRREGHTSVVFDNKIWVIGGWNGYERNDVWYSLYGVNWYCATENAPWSGRWEHTSVVFDNKIWVLGGCDSSCYRNDVWCMVSEKEKPRYPCDLVISDIKFYEPSNNNKLDGHEKGEIRFKIENKGKGEAINVKAKITPISLPQGLDYNKLVDIGIIKPKEVKEVKVDVSGKGDLKTGEAKFRIEVLEEYGYDAEPFTISFNTESFKPPSFILADYGIDDDKEGESYGNNNGII